MQKSLLITIVLILLVQGLVHGQRYDEEQDLKIKILSEQLANVIERLDHIESCQNNVQSVLGMH
jgi:hypothetical protein